MGAALSSNGAPPATTNAAEVISLALASINSVNSVQGYLSILSITTPTSLPPQDTATGDIYFSIPYPSIETGPAAGSNSATATTLPSLFTATTLPAPSGAAMSTSDVSSIPSQVSNPTASPFITITSSTGTPSLSSTSIPISSTSVSSLSSITTVTASSSSSTTSSSSSSSSSSSHSSSRTLPAAAATSTGTTATSLKRTHPLSVGAIVGIVIGVGIALILLAAALLYLLRRRTHTHRPIPQSPLVYPEEAYLYDPPIDPPPRAVRGSSGSSLRPGSRPEPETVMGEEGDGLLLGVPAAAAAAQRRENRARGLGTEDRDGRWTLDPFADPGQPERWPLDPGGHNAALFPEELDLGHRFYVDSSARVSGEGDRIGVAISPDREEAPIGVGGLGGRSVGPHNYDIPGRYGPGGIVRGGNDRRTRMSGVRSGSSGENAASPEVREIRRASG